jgi:dTDP-D-glucose 4,6-dehydratase
MSDVAAVRRLVVDLKPDTVFHLAGFVSGDRSLAAVLPSLQANLVATVNLLTAVTGLAADESSWPHHWKSRSRMKSW